MQGAASPSSRQGSSLRAKSVGAAVATMAAPFCRRDERWQAHLGCDEYLDAPAEFVILCPTSAEREFGGDT